MELSIFFQLSLVLALAAGVSLLFRALHQPLIIGYIATGFIMGPSLFNLMGANHAAFESFSQIGIVLLLFMIGLGLDTNVIRSTGKPVIVTFLAVVLGVGTIGYIAARLLGFTEAESPIIAIALLFSSTIIVVKSLLDKRVQSRLYSQIAVGVLLVEDVAATVALLVVSAGSGGAFTVETFASLFIRGVALTVLVLLAGRAIMPRLSRLFAQSQELLYTFALAWGFGVASLFLMVGFSIEVGALFAGVALAHLPYAQEITTRLKPLRDFFVLLFFIELGQRLSLDNIGLALWPAIVFSLIIMVSKPLLTLMSLGALGYTKQTGFKAAVHLSQISEFSIILVVLAQKMGIASANVTVAITLTALITIIVSTYLMNDDDRLYRKLKGPLSIFERKDVKREVTDLRHYPLVLLGYKRGGHEFIDTFRKMSKRYVVVDYDPDVIEAMEHQHINHIYGDATDLELLDEIGVRKSELIISTIADSATNRLLVQHIMNHHKEAVFVCHAPSYEDAEMLYDAGATYVILPHFIGSDQINTFIRRHGSDKPTFEKYRRQQSALIGRMMME